MSDYVNHIVLCGYEQGATMLLDILRKEVDIDANRVVLFANTERPLDLPPEFLWVRGDPTKESELDKVRLTHASTVIVTGSRNVPPQQADAATILTSFTIRSYMKDHPSAEHRKKPLQIVAEILDSENVAHARAAGADEVIETRKVGFSLLSRTVAFPGIADVTSHMVFAGMQNLYTCPVPASVNTPQSFDDVSSQVRRENGVLVIGVRDPITGEEKVNPAANEPVQASMQLLYLSDQPKL